MCQIQNVIRFRYIPPIVIEHRNKFSPGIKLKMSPLMNKKSLITHLRRELKMKR